MIKLKEYNYKGKKIFKIKIQETYYNQIARRTIKTYPIRYKYKTAIFYRLKDAKEFIDDNSTKE